MHLRHPADHESSAVGSVVVKVNDALTSIERSCGRQFLFLYFERDADDPGKTNWFCSLGGRPLGSYGLSLLDLYEQLDTSSPIPEDWFPFIENEPLGDALTNLQQTLIHWNYITGQPNLVIVRAQNPSRDPRCGRRLVNGKPVPEDNDGQSDLDLITTFFYIDPTQPLI